MCNIEKSGGCPPDFFYCNLHPLWYNKTKNFWRRFLCPDLVAADTVAAVAAEADLAVEAVVFTAVAAVAPVLAVVTTADLPIIGPRIITHPMAAGTDPHSGADGIPVDGTMVAVDVSAVCLVL